MQVTANATYSIMQNNLNQIESNLQTLQIEGSTGLSLNQPSDDPSVISPVINARQQITETGRYITTMGATTNQMQSTDTYLGSIITLLGKAQSEAQSAVNGTNSTADLSSLADQVNQIQQQMMQTANSEINDQYLFSGEKVTTEPFTTNPNYSAATYNAADSTTWPVLYNGDANQTQVEIAPSESVQTNLTGNELFLGISNSNWNGTTTAASNQPESGKVDIFTVLSQTAAAIQAGNVNNASGPGGGIENCIANLQTAANQVDGLRSQLGNQAATVTNVTTQMQSVQTDLQTTLGNYQDANSTTVFSDISNLQSAYQAALDITSQISKVSILNYM